MNQHHLLLVAALTLTFSSSLCAQFATFEFENLALEHGLPNNRIRCIFQDSRGFLWIGTENGLARYDGQRFKIFSNDKDDTTSISTDRVLTIFEDRSQTLWFGTSYSLNRFDRYSEKFKCYLPSPEDSLKRRGHDVRAIYEDSDGTLWVSFVTGADHLGGFYKFEPKTQTFIRYQHNPNNPQSLSQNLLTFLVEDDAGKFWLGTQEYGLDRFDPKTGAVIKNYRHDPGNPNSVSQNNSLYVWYGLKDRRGQLWFTCYGGGLNKYDPGLDGFLHYRHDSQNARSLYSDAVLPIIQDSQGMIWVGNGVLSRMTPDTETFDHFRFSPRQGDPASNYMPYALHEDRARNLWVGTRGNGIYKVNLKPQKFTHYKRNPEDGNSLIDNDIRIIYEDAKSTIWIGTRESGLSHFDPAQQKFRNFSHARNDQHSLSSNAITAILEDCLGNIWIGTSAGLNKFDPNRQNFTRYQHDPMNPKSLNDNRIEAIYEDRSGTLWIGTIAGGLNRFDHRTGKFDHFVPNPKAAEVTKDNHLVRFFEDRHANLWIESIYKHYLFDRKTKRFTLVEPIGPSVGGWGKGLLEDRNGTIWGVHYGVYKLDVQQMKFIRTYPATPNSNSGYGQNAQAHASPYLDKNRMIWCGTRYGLHKFDPQKKDFAAHYYEQDGLVSNFILKILSDEDGRLWLLTDRGISIFAEQAPAGKQFKSLAAVDGIVNAPTTTADFTFTAFDTFIKTRNGEIWWGGNNGVHRFYPNVKSTNPHAPPVLLTGFKKFNEIAKLDTAISEIKTIPLDYDENFFSFTFSALDFTNARQNQYAYQLAGFDKDWIQAGNKREASYTNVPPGTYTFRVKGSNNDGVWNETGTSVQIIITPPFWQTWWFRMALALAVIAFLAALYNYRVSKLLEIERTRLRIARDLHDDVGSSLSSIALTAELLQKESATDGLTNRQLARVHETAQKLSRNLKEIVWAIDPHRDKFDDLLLHIKEAAEELLGQKGIAYTLDIPQDELPQSLKMEFRRNLFLIYKEMLHNVVKHAEATKVEIALTRMNGVLQLQVADNGKGFCTEAVGNGNGMKSMQARAGELNGQLEIDSQPERGTRVTLSVICK